ncbi:MAG: M13 family metallopeptidase, partial [Muribaculaceae bacterium]|nr:M13 family metallopeptidase [Muribaculaceae bacterium]
MNKLFFAGAMLVATSMSLSAQEHLKSLNPGYIDQTTPASKDFYQHVNKGWMEAHPLTAEHARYGQFNILSDSSEYRVRDIVTHLAATNPKPGTVAFKVSTIYNQSLDSVRRNNDGAKPILADLKKIETTPADGMNDLLLWMHTSYANPFFGAGPMEDMANSNVYAMYLSGGGLGMGDRDYYLLDDAENKKVREAYKKLIARQMQNAGYSKKDAARIVKNVMKIETLLADSTWTREQSRNIPAMYNVRTIDQLKADYPHVDWDNYFMATMEIPTPETVIVTNPNTMKQADNLIGALSEREMKDYMLWQYVSQASGKLSDAFSDANFDFNKVVSGVQQQRPRWKRALGATEGALGEAIGQLYVEKYFPESSKQYMLGLV